MKREIKEDNKMFTWVPGMQDNPDLKKHKNLEETTRSLYAASLKWSEEYEKAKTGKQLAGVSKGALDELTAGTLLALRAATHLDTVASKNGEGVEISMKLAREAKGLAVTNEEAGKNLASNMSKHVENINKRVKSNLTVIQQIQLEKSENAMIVRGIPMANADPRRKETYMELEAAVQATFQGIGCPALKFKSIRRLQISASAKAKAQPPSLRVEVASQGDKHHLFTAVEKFTRQQRKLPFSVTHEIPRYAINAYKYCQAIAAIVRENNPEVKTRVSIPRGEHWPVIMMKAEQEVQYSRLSAEWFKAAKEKYIEQNRRKAAARKAAKGGNGIRLEPAMDIGNY